MNNKYGMVMATFEEDGHYYVRDEQGRTRIIEVENGKIFDGRQLLSDLCKYDILGPVPTLEELEALNNITAAPFNPCSEMTP